MPRRLGRPESLAELLAELPEDLRRQAFTHSSWVEHRAEAYERLAFLGDVVLSLAVSDHLFPRFERYGAGRLTKVRAQAVSGSSCARVARELGVPERAARRGAASSTGPQRRHAGRVRARARVGLRGDHRRRLPRLRHRARRRRRWSSRSRSEIEQALENPVDYKSVLQERLARRAEVVAYRTVSEEGPAHDRSFVAVAEVDGRGAGPRRGKDEEGRRAGGGPARAGRPRRRGGRRNAPALDLDEGLQVLPATAPSSSSAPGVSVVVGPERLRQVEHHRRRAVGARRAVAARGARAVDEGRDLRRRARGAGLERRRGRGGDRQLTTARSTSTSPRSRSSAAWTATARASTA